MGRKPLPISEVRRVISVSLKPSTIDAIDHMRGDTPRSRWLEQMVEHLQPIHEGVNAVQYELICDSCQKTWILNKKMEKQRLDDNYFHCPRCNDILCKSKVSQ